MGTIRIAALLSVVVAVVLGEKGPPRVWAVGGARNNSQYAALSRTLPMSFELNRGQTDGRVRFLARGHGYTLYLTSSDAVLTPHLRLANQGFVRLHYVAGSPHATVVGLHRLPGKANYFVGNNPRHWHTDIPTYAAVEYGSVYHGINLVYYGRQGHLEYDWIVQPGADPHTIRLAVSGPSTVRLDHHGNLLFSIGGVTLLQQKALVYQPVGRVRRMISVRYTLNARHEVGFALGPYDSRKPLVIDPTLMYSTYLGGQDEDGAAGIAVDANGQAYVTGDTMSLDFPLKHPAQGSLQSDRSCTDSQGHPGAACTDAFVTKLNVAGTALVYSTYLGGSRDDAGHAIALDGAGNAFLTGNTRSTNFPTVRAVQPRFGGGSVLGDAFVTKLDAAGNKLVYSTYLGGKGEDDGNGIAVANGSAYVTGRTNSSNFPTVHALQRHPGGGRCRYDFDPHGLTACYDAFVAKLNPAGSALSYSTYLGGNRTDFGWGIAVHQSRAYVAGQTTSTTFPTVNSFQRTYGGGTCGAAGVGDPCSDAFVAELNVQGTALIYSTYLGGSREDIANAVKVDSAGNAYVVGKTESPNFPIAHALQASFVGGPDMAFVTKLDATGHALLYSTYLGGRGGDEAYGVALNGAGDAYVTGRTSSTKFPTIHAVQKRLATGESPQNAFVTELNSTGGGLIYSTFLGGNDHDLGGDIAVDAAGNAYVAGFATSLNFPTVHPIQRALGGGTFDAFVAKLGNPHASLPRRTCREGYKRVRGKCERTRP